jgi:hypothetical protein
MTPSPSFGLLDSVADCDAFLCSLHHDSTSNPRVHHRSDRHDRVRVHQKRHASSDRRNFAYNSKRFVIVDPEANNELARKHGVGFVRKAITKESYEEILRPPLEKGGGQGFCMNLFRDTRSVNLLRLMRRIPALYIDTVDKPRAGLYSDTKISLGRHT